MCVDHIGMGCCAINAIKLEVWSAFKRTIKIFSLCVTLYIVSLSFYAPPLMGGDIKRCFCLTFVAYIGPNSRTERPRKTKIGTEVAHVTCDWDTISRSKGQLKGQGHRAALPQL